MLQYTFVLSHITCVVMLT